MLKKYTIRSIIMLVIAQAVPYLFRFWNNKPVEDIHPFIFGSGRDGNPLRISVQWYVKDIGEAVSYTLVMFTVCMVLVPVIRHLQEVKWSGHQGLLIFVTVWQRLFFIIFITSIFDLIHYLIAFKTLDYYFLILNAVYFIASFYYIFKLWKR